MTQDANDLLMSGGIKAFTFERMGDTALGTIVDEPKAAQMNKYKSKELDFWPSGDPKMQIVVTIQTDLRDPANAVDDGRRRLYIVPRMMTPVREAILRAGGKGLAIGGRIAVRWFAGSGEGEGNARQYQADYAAPVVDPGSLLAGAPAQVAQAPLSAASAQAAPVQAAPPNGATAAAASPTLLSMASTPAGPPPGVDSERWATLPDAQKQAVLAAMGVGPGY